MPNICTKLIKEAGCNNITNVKLTSHLPRKTFEFMTKIRVSMCMYQWDRNRNMVHDSVIIPVVALMDLDTRVYKVI